MIDEKEILPFNFFSYGGTYTGHHGGMRYKIKKTGEKPDLFLTGYVWKGPFASDAVDPELIISESFPFSNEGRSACISWILSMYESKKEEWDH